MTPSAASSTSRHRVMIRQYQYKDDPPYWSAKLLFHGNVVAFRCFNTWTGAMNQADKWTRA